MNDQKNSEQQEASIRSQIQFLQAQEAALCGHYEHAESILSGIENEAIGPDALDLMARIAVQKGQIKKARQLWAVVLKKDPGNEKASAALKRLHSSWLSLAIFKRVVFLAIIAALIFMTCYGALALISRKASILEENSVVYSTPHLSVPKLPLPVQPTGQDSPVEPTAEMQQLQLPEWSTPKLSVEGWTVSTGENEWCAVPNEALFGWRSELTEDAVASLSRMAEALGGNVEECWIVIEGHTDSDPMSANSQYRDNDDLAFHRALAVGQQLRARSDLPAKSILLTTSATSKPLFNEDSAESKARNKTAVIKLYPKNILLREVMDIVE